MALFLTNPGIALIQANNGIPLSYLEEQAQQKPGHWQGFYNWQKIRNGPLGPNREALDNNGYQEKKQQAFSYSTSNYTKGPAGKPCFDPETSPLFASSVCVTCGSSKHSTERHPPCEHCKQRDHQEHRCPNQSQIQGSPNQGNQGQQGHKGHQGLQSSNQIPTVLTVSNQLPLAVCENCAGFGHNQRYCVSPNPVKPNSKGIYEICDNCGGHGHTQNQCNIRWL